MSKSVSLALDYYIFKDGKKEGQIDATIKVY
jgi:hypothetical protein